MGRAESTKRNILSAAVRYVLLTDAYSDVATMPKWDTDGKRMINKIAPIHSKLVTAERDLQAAVRELRKTAGK